VLARGAGWRRLPLLVLELYSTTQRPCAFSAFLRLLLSPSKETVSFQDSDAAENGIIPSFMGVTARCLKAAYIRACPAPDFQAVSFGALACPIRRTPNGQRRRLGRRYVRRSF
jgi:hypothetical protein